MNLTRRQMLQLALAAGAAAALPRHARADESIHRRIIPASGERLPAIGMGTWITFDVGMDAAAREVRVEVLRRFFAAGGRVVDSSPMYGSSPAVLGHCLYQLDNDEGLFAASKVWIPGAERGMAQMEVSRQRWGIERFDLMQVHNLLDWQAHLPTLQRWRDEGKVRYVGLTTSHGRRHSELEQIVRQRPVDFIQLTYNIAEREAERQLLPMAADLGRAVIINRPFATGGLFRQVRGRPLPAIAAEIGAASWAQLFLKFVISHPAVTCAIPATSQPDHMTENMGALRGPLPDAGQRQAMIRAFEAA